jgi:cardiolipin synthase A/B
MRTLAIVSIVSLAACSSNAPSRSTTGNDTTSQVNCQLTPNTPRSTALQLFVQPPDPWDLNGTDNQPSQTQVSTFKNCSGSAVNVDIGEQPIVNAVLSAQKGIDLLIYQMGTDAVYQALVAQASCGGPTGIGSGKGIKVRVIFDQNTEKEFNTSAFNGLQSAGASVRWANPGFSNTHAKTMVVDPNTANQKMVVSTGNYPLRYIQTERNYVAIDTDPTDIFNIAEIFDNDWALAAANTSVDPSSTSQNGATILGLSCNASSSSGPWLGTRMLVSPVDPRQDIVNVINGATQSVHVESLEFSDPDVIAALVNAKTQRNLEVKILIADPNWDGNCATYTCDTVTNAEQMATNGIPIEYMPYDHSLTDSSPAYYTQMLTHVKSIIVDQGTSNAYAYMGSENLSTQSLTENREVGLVVQEADNVATMESTFEGDFASPKAVACSTTFCGGNQPDAGTNDGGTIDAGTDAVVPSPSGSDDGGGDGGFSGDDGGVSDGDDGGLGGD